MLLILKRVNILLIFLFFVSCTFDSLNSTDDHEEDSGSFSTEIDYGVLPEEGRADWANAGVQGGIPEYPVAINVRNAPYNAVGNGSADDTAAIQAAIDACAEGQAVLIPAGTYNLSGRLTIAKSIVLRGEGPRLTHLIQTSQNNSISIEPGGDWAGIEDLHVHINHNPNAIAENHINLFSVQNSWVKNIETSGYVRNNVRLMNSSHCEVRDSYIHNGYDEVVNGNGTDGYGILLYGSNQGADGGSGSCDYNLIENNIVDWMRHALILLKHCSNNVYAYNFCWNNWSQNLSQSHCLKLHHPDYIIESRIITYTLSEGNACEMIGSQAQHRFNTFFRNRAMGGNLAGLGVQPYNYAIGNELTAHKHQSFGINNTLNAKAGSLTHGNYIADGDGIQWDPSIEERTISNSYYLTERPEWFGDLDWPCYGGDLMEADLGNNKRRSPAEVRYWTMLFPENAPENLQADVSDNNIALSWTHNPHDPDSIVDFIIVRSSDNESFFRIGVTDGTQFTDSSLDSGTYFYYVKARNHSGGMNGGDLGGESDATNTIRVDIP